MLPEMEKRTTGVRAWLAVSYPLPGAPQIPPLCFDASRPQVRPCHPLLERPPLAPVTVQQEHGSGVMADEHTCGSRHEKTHSPLPPMQVENLSKLHTWLCFTPFPVECPGATRSRTALLYYTLAVPMAQPRCPCTSWQGMKKRP